MAYPLKVFLELAKLDQKLIKNKNVIGVGSHNISFEKISKKYEKILNIDCAYINKKIKTLHTLNSKNNDDGYYDLNKEIVKYLLDKIGFGSYEDADINGLADIKINLNEEVPINLQNKFGVVINSGTSNYATNIIKAYENSMKLCDLNGYVVNFCEPINFNRFPLSPSPNFLIDIFCKNGFRVNYAQIIKHNEDGSFVADLKMFYNYKEYYLIQYLSFFQFLGHIFYEFCTYFLGRKNKSYIDPRDYHKIKKKKFTDFSKKYPSVKFEKLKSLLIKITSKFARPFYNKHKKSGRVILYLMFQKIEVNEINIENYNESSLHYEIEYKL
tara:strand:+ start:51 stop:1031 length:981 start_codon:yes stop_codon:yes gene_type:complete